MSRDSEFRFPLIDSLIRAVGRLQLKQLFDRQKLVASICFVAIPALLFYWLSVAIMTDAGFTVVQILRDPAQQTKVSSFLGFLSNIGIWFWVSAAALCFFSLLTNPLHSPYRTRELLLVLGLMSLLLAVDDMFMLHDRYIHQKSIFNFYAICCLILLFRHYARIVFINGFAFMFAGFLLALSIYIDTHQKKMGVDYSVHQLVEEGFKFVGAALWLYFCGQVASARARETNLDAD